MLIALVLFNIVHPGKIMAGKESDFPNRKERKDLGLARNIGHGIAVLPTKEPSEAGSAQYF